MALGGWTAGSGVASSRSSLGGSGTQTLVEQSEAGRGNGPPKLGCFWVNCRRLEEKITGLQSTINAMLDAMSMDPMSISTADVVRVAELQTERNKLIDKYEQCCA